MAHIMDGRGSFRYPWAVRESPGPIRVLMAKPGLDGHNRGVRIIVTALREAGMEVVYTGIRLSVEAVVKSALEEDVDALGLSCLSGAHGDLFPRVAQGMRQAGAGEVLLFCGGIIPEEDHPALKAAGFAGIFGPGTSTGEIVRFVQDEVAKRRARVPR